MSIRDYLSGDNEFNLEDADEIFKDSLVGTDFRGRYSYMYTDGIEPLNEDSYVGKVVVVENGEKNILYLRIEEEEGLMGVEALKKNYSYITRPSQS